MKCSANCNRFQELIKNGSADRFSTEIQACNLIKEARRRNTAARIASGLELQRGDRRF